MKEHSESREPRLATPAQEATRVCVDGRWFRRYMSADEVAESVRGVAEQLGRDLGALRDADGRPPLLLPVLNGAYIFAADLTRALSFDAEISFVKMASYVGTRSTEQLTTLIGLPDGIRGRHVVLVEDVVDTGVSMRQVRAQVAQAGAASVRVCTLFFKPGKFRGGFAVDYIGREIADDFIVGYGLDYNGLGRFYKDIYILDE
ncbi:MAG: hypoxanthine phosphoribosyltransferase [Bacteroidales bacterium]|nr:hypoxanthine phosphoribosyltransferase [Bacteroidales bacterium]